MDHTKLNTQAKKSIRKKIMTKSQFDMDKIPGFDMACSKMKNFDPKMCTLITSIIVFWLSRSASTKISKKTCIVNSKSAKISKLSKLKAVKFKKIEHVKVSIKRLVICTLKNWFQPTSTSQNQVKFGPRH